MTYITTALELEPDNRIALVGQALFLERQGKFERAMIEIDEVLKIWPEHPFILLRKAELLVKLADDNLDNYKQASSYYDQVLASDPNNVEAIVGKGNIFSEEGEYDKALLAYDQALQLQPRNDGAHLGKGTVYLELEQYNDAIERFDMVLTDNRDNVLVLNKKGEALMKLGKCKEAIAVFETTLQIDPANLIVLTNKGDAASALGKPRQASRSYDRALNIDPDHVDAILGKGLALVKIERYEESLAYFDDVLEIEFEIINKTEGKWHAESEEGNDALKGKIEAMTGLGNLHLEGKKWEAAKARFNDALALDFEHGEAKNGKFHAEGEISQGESFDWLGVVSAGGAAVAVGTFAYAKLRKKEKTNG